MNVLPAYRTIALAKEIESPENPQGLERRVALTPKDVTHLAQAGFEVFVERGAGKQMGYSDEDYLSCGVTLQNNDQIYRDKDLIIKFKGPAMESIEHMRPGCTLLCMAHFHSFPARAKRLQEQRINVIAMEEILESPKQQCDSQILGRTAMQTALQAFIGHDAMNRLDVRIIGWSKRLAPAIRRASNRNPKSLKVIQANTSSNRLDVTGPWSLYFYDSREFTELEPLLTELRKTHTHCFDLAEYEDSIGPKMVASYRSSHPEFEFGLRRIQCLHETGQAGAKYGIKLMQENQPNLLPEQVKAVVLGYGNVGQGAIDAIHEAGIEHLHVLGRGHTTSDQIETYLHEADLIINAAEQDLELRGKNYLITDQHLKNAIKDKAVIIDLVGGSETNRSPVEPVLNCTFLTDPHFIQDNVTVSALWGWPMLGMELESTQRYSSQIVDVLIGREKLLEGLNPSNKGLKRALVCGPFVEEKAHS